MIAQKTPGYDRWCAAARRAHPEWDTATPETREPWIVQARQKENDADAARVSQRPPEIKPSVK
jgi:hypothetical protein